MKLLIGVDGSSGSLAAVAMAGQLTAADKDQLALYFAPPRVAVRGGAVEQSPEIMERLQGALVEAVFDKAREQLPEPRRASVHTIIGTQDAREGVLVAADEWRADVVVVGARGLGPIDKLLLGSVSQTVAHHSSLPVLVVRWKEDPSSDPLRVLLAYDDSLACRQAGQLLNRFHWPAGTVGRVITVIEPMTPGHLPAWLASRVRDPQTEAMAQAWAQEHAAEKQAKQAKLSELARQLPAVFQGVEPIVAEGHPAQEILAAVAEHQIDLAVVGTRGAGLWSRLLMGSTSQTILSQATCSVLLVPQHEVP